MFARERTTRVRPAAIPTLSGLTLARQSFAELPAFFHDLARTYGPIVRFRNLRRSIYFIDDPGLLEEVFVTKAASYKKGRGTERLAMLLGKGLLTAKQPEHLVHRRLVQPAFHKKRIDACAEVVVAAAARRASAWVAGETIDVDTEALHLALEIVAKALFGSDLASDIPTIETSLDTAIATFPFAMLPFSELFDNLPIPTTLRLRKAREALDAIVYRMMAEHRASGDTGDLLSMLLASRDDANAGMDDEQVRDEALTILLAGHETTANAIAWTFYLLQRHPEIEARLHAHLDVVLGDRDPTLDDIPQLDYVRAVFAETMRLYPPAWVTARRALEATTLGEHPVAKNDIVIVSQFVTHRNPRLWPSPERFDPERFMGPPPAEKFAYFPFGGGNRRCIGERFAWMEGILAIATIARRVRLELVDPKPVETQPFVTLRPKSAIRARVALRSARDSVTTSN